MIGKDDGGVFYGDGDYYIDDNDNHSFAIVNYFTFILSIIYAYMSYYINMLLSLPNYSITFLDGGSLTIKSSSTDMFDMFI